MNVKYKKNMLQKVAGVAWLIVMMLNIGQLIILHNVPMPDRFTGLVLLNVILSFVIAVNYFRLPLIDYLRLDDKELSIHRGLVRRRKIIRMKEIERTKYQWDCLFLILRDGKEVKIRPKLITISDFERVEVKLEEVLKVN
ncbi:hypothetical protein [Bacillus solimangrovi]|uniref:Uncharacterized protein n=1 Tax=Bacillus solimangrovi TaxID=1305675 RepID=A0A1E5LKK4_9BACI|nr:hypothetical protein [Bacillus solimangrovi]OEH94558.1 hypothetical protein BFG57_07780 [Bacillus solimangrovi]